MLQPNFNQIAQHCPELHGAAQHATQQQLCFFFFWHGVLQGPFTQGTF